MTLSRCTGEPISWLRLERYHLGELAEGERARVAEHLTVCATCAECMERIEADEAVILPALELGAGAGRAASVATPAPPRRWRLLASAGALAAAAVMVLGIGRTWRGSGTPMTERETALLKGDGMAFVLVREDGQRVVDAQGVFRDGDRFKALVTCPPAMGANFDLVVFDASGASFPLAPAPGFACGNEVPLPGAFRLTAEPGGHETVCVVWTDAEQVDRAALSRNGVASPRSMCKELRAAP